MQYVKIRDKDTGLFSMGHNAFDFIPITWNENPTKGQLFWFVSEIKEHLQDNKNRYKDFPNLELVFFDLVENRSEPL